jgi:hypothetical protein
MNLQIFNTDSLKAQYQKAALTFQSLLQQDNLAEGIKEAKKQLKEVKDKRLDLTRQVEETFITPFILMERQLDALIKEASGRELEMRIALEKRIQEANAIIAEEADFKAFCENEWYRIAQTYRMELKAFILDCYQTHLKNRTATPVKTIVRDVQESLSMVRLSAMAKYQPRHLTKERMAELYAGIHKYDNALDLATAKSQVEVQFLTYEMDLANAELVSKQIEAEKQAAFEKSQQEIAMNQATTTLIAQAEAVTIELPKVKRELKVVIVESELWAVSVCNNFIRLLPQVAPYLRVKSWGNLTLSQMADALAKYMSETGEKIHNLKTEEVCK